MDYSKIKSLINKLSREGIKVDIRRGGEFYDEPGFFRFDGRLVPDKKKFKGYVGGKFSEGGGFSFDSPEAALSKCLFELMERLSLALYKKKQIVKRPSSKNPSDFINLLDFSKDNQIKDKKMSWVWGQNLTNGKKVLLPAQLIYLRYKLFKGEPTLDYPRNSTGAAGGSSHNHATLNAIYEAIERDSFTSIYLAGITPPRVRLDKLNNKTINAIVNKCLRYKLELYVLDITTDIGVPSFLSVVIDRTGVGPAVSVGAKTSLRAIDAVIGAITESFMMRIVLKYMIKNGDIFENKPKPKNFALIRGPLWIAPPAIENINFLITGDFTAKLDSFNGTTETELAEVIKKLKKTDRSVYSIDITLDELKKFNFFAVKVLIPNLEPLYLYESEKEKSLNMERLRQVASFFGEKLQDVNPVPHPFL